MWTQAPPPCRRDQRGGRAREAMYQTTAAEDGDQEEAGPQVAGVLMIVNDLSGLVRRRRAVRSGVRC
jgi:hypothetical protein